MIFSMNSLFSMFKLRSILSNTHKMTNPIAMNIIGNSTVDSSFLITEADMNHFPFRCLGVQVFRCLGVQVFRCSGVQVFMCLYLYIQYLCLHFKSQDEMRNSFFNDSVRRIRILLNLSKKSIAHLYAMLLK